MPSVNPGPATTQTQSQLATLTPVNALGPTVPGQAGNALRLIAVGRGVSLSGTGDAALMGVINSTSFVPTVVVFSNGLINGVTGNIAAGSVSVNTGAAATGTVVRTAGVLTGMTSTAVALVSASPAAGTDILGVTGLYFNVATAVAGGTVDCFVYAYDVS